MMMKMKTGRRFDADLSFGSGNYNYLLHKASSLISSTLSLPPFRGGRAKGFKGVEDIAREADEDTIGRARCSSGGVHDLFFDVHVHVHVHVQQSTSRSSVSVSVIGSSSSSSIVGVTRSTPKCG